MRKAGQFGKPQERAKIGDFEESHRKFLQSGFGKAFALIQQEKLELRWVSL